jgi:hypothetical protein
MTGRAESLPRIAARSPLADPQPLIRPIQNPAALLAADDFLPCLHAVRRLRRDLHVATGANLVHQTNHSRITLAGKQPLEPIKNVLVNPASDLRTFGE